MSNNNSLQPHQKSDEVAKDLPLRGEIVQPRSLPEGSSRYIRDIVAIIAATIVLLVVFIGGMTFAGVKAAQDFTSGIADSLFGVCLMDCGPEYVIETGPILQRLQQQSWIEGVRANNNFAQLSISKDRPGPLGADSLKYNAVVVVTGGVDLEFFSEDDIEVKGDDVTIYLPAPQVRDCFIDEQNSKFYDGECSVAGIIPTNVCDELQNELRTQALVASANADHQELLKEAFEGASETVLSLVGNIEGIDKVIIQQSSEEIPMFSANGTCIQHQKEE